MVIKKLSLTLLILFMSITLLTGCGNDSNTTTNPTISVENTLLGSAFKGSIDAATVTITDATGTILSTTVSQKGKFELTNISLPTNNEAVFIETTGGQYMDEATRQKVTLGSHGLMSVFIASELQAIMEAKQVIALTPETTIMAMLVKKSLAANTAATQAISDAKTIVQNQWIKGSTPGPMPDDDLFLIGDLSTAVPISVSESLARNRAISFSFEAQGKKLLPLQAFELISKTADDLSDGTLDGKNNGIALTYTDSNGVSHDLSQEDRKVQYGMARNRLVSKTLNALFAGKLSDDQVAGLEVMGFATDFVATLRNKDAAAATATSSNLTASNLPDFNHLPVLSDEDGNSDDNAATYTLTANPSVNVNINAPGTSWQTPMMRYNGLQLPPVIKVKRNDAMTLNLVNDLSSETTIHWHGFKIPADQDGGPDFPVAANGAKQYSFTMLQAASSLWFHPHPDMKTGEQVYRGLAGVFLLSDAISQQLEADKQLPNEQYDIPVVLQDRRFNPENNGIRELAYKTLQFDSDGMLGDTLLVNGSVLPKLAVETRQYRFRIYNTSNARSYDIALSNNANFKIVGSDGGLLAQPAEVNHITLGAAERAEIIVDFSQYAVGEKVMLISKAFNGSPMMPMMVSLIRNESNSTVNSDMINNIPVNGNRMDIMRFDISTQVSDDVSLYTALPASADINTQRLTANDASKTRNFVMSMLPNMNFVINGKAFDMNRIDETITLSEGDTEIWSIQNRSPMAHPFHAHAIQWQVLSRGGKETTGIERGWKDTVLVQSGETVDLIGRFDPVVNYGDYMYHCHILEHEDAGMMGFFKIQQ